MHDIVGDILPAKQVLHVSPRPRSAATAVPASAARCLSKLSTSPQAASRCPSKSCKRYKVTDHSPLLFLLATCRMCLACVAASGRSNPSPSAKRIPMTLLSTLFMCVAHGLSAHACATNHKSTQITHMMSALLIMLPPISTSALPTHVFISKGTLTSALISTTLTSSRVSMTSYLVM